MAKHRKAARMRTYVGAAVVVGALATVSACGSGSGGSTAAATGSNSAALPPAASQRLATALKPITAFPGPTTPISPVSGTKVTVITCSATGATCVRVASGVQAAGKILGWNVDVVDGQGQPATWNAAMSAAVASKTQGIILAGVPPQLVEAGLKAAQAAKIPVVYDLGLGAQGADAIVSTDHAETGRVLADFIASDSGGKAQVMVLHDPEFPELQQLDTAFAAELKTACPSCSIKSEQNFTLGAMAQTLPGMVQTAMQQNPGIGYVLVPYDSASAFVDQGVRAAGHAAVKVLGSGGDAPTIASLRSGAEYASMGVPSEWMGFQSVDAIARLLAGKPVPNVPVVQGLITKSNISSQAPSGTYSGGFDYAAAYKKIWGK